MRNIAARNGRDEIVNMLKYIGLSVFLAGILNFAAFGIHTTCKGGSAYDGRVMGGHYFVSEHGRETEVSKTVYDRLLMHEKSAMISFPIALVAGIIWGALQSDSSKAPNDK